MESQLACPLFDRIGRDVYLTEAGELLRQRARAVIDELRDIQTSVSQLNNRDIRQLSMASSHHIGLHYLGPLLKAFVDQNPLAELDLRFMESELAIASLLKREVELVFTTIPSPLNKLLNARVIWRDQLKFVVAPDHPLARRQGTVRLNELTQTTAILPDPQTTTYQIIEQTFQRHHIPLKRVLNVNYLETIRALVANGLGWSLLPATMVDDSLAILTVDKVELTRNLGIIWHRQRTVSRAAEVFMTLLAQATAGR